MSYSSKPSHPSSGGSEDESSPPSHRDADGACVALNSVQFFETLNSEHFAMKKAMEAMAKHVASFERELDKRKKDWKEEKMQLEEARVCASLSSAEAQKAWHTLATHCAEMQSMIDALLPVAKDGVKKLERQQDTSFNPKHGLNTPQNAVHKPREETRSIDAASVAASHENEGDDQLRAELIKSKAKVDELTSSSREQGRTVNALVAEIDHLRRQYEDDLKKRASLLESQIAALANAETMIAEASRHRQTLEEQLARKDDDHDAHVKLLQADVHRVERHLGAALLELKERLDELEALRDRVKVETAAWDAKMRQNEAQLTVVGMEKARLEEQVTLREGELKRLKIAVQCLGTEMFDKLARALQEDESRDPTRDKATAEQVDDGPKTIGLDGKRKGNEFAQQSCDCRLCCPDTPAEAAATAAAEAVKTTD